MTDYEMLIAEGLAPQWAAELVCEAERGHLGAMRGISDIRRARGRRTALLTPTMVPTALTLLQDIQRAQRRIEGPPTAAETPAAPDMENDE